MKKLVFLFLLYVTSVAGQSHQQDIIKFVDDNKGKKIGKGLCYELVEEAIRTYNPEYNATTGESDKYGKKVKRESVQVGDILVLSGGSKVSISHVCIVYSISGDDIFVAEQNTKGKLKDSIVVVNYLNSEWMEDYYGKVRYNFYRPQ